jgi:hypothetical protein
MVVLCSATLRETLSIVHVSCIPVSEDDRRLCSSYFLSSVPPSNAAENTKKKYPDLTSHTEEKYPDLTFHTLAATCTFYRCDSGTTQADTFSAAPHPTEALATHPLSPNRLPSRKLPQALASLLHYHHDYLRIGAHDSVPSASSPLLRSPF